MNLYAVTGQTCLMSQKRAGKGTEQKQGGPTYFTASKLWKCTWNEPTKMGTGDGQKATNQVQSLELGQRSCFSWHSVLALLRA